MGSASLDRTRAAQIGALDKLFPILILLCMAAGLLLGKSS